MIEMNGVIPLPPLINTNVSCLSSKLTTPSQNIHSGTTLTRKSLSSMFRHSKKNFTHVSHKSSTTNMFSQVKIH